MTGKILSIILIVSGLAAGLAMYYLQVYGYYDDVTARPGQDVMLLPIGGETPEPIAYGDFTAIDADSSPIRYRACFTTPRKPAELAQLYQLSEVRAPRNAPGWFDCFDAARLGAALRDGAAMAFLAEANIEFGVDRIVAVTEDGRGYIWHELNNCGEKAYDGTIVGDECPPRPDAGQ
ncbi:DUF6446 family protein [Tritonibacter horizontis]|uniref:Histidine kinase n=1 Tax=Tritonibacter horizontis TaxID=1768241 RepID=A0A132C041_9RHOB|nr:DUF6446 family protein [Tritonibacter horizontis]KUP93958.1 hypothetical protein TRIHO_11390 [Tritonibacter horizontis]